MYKQNQGGWILALQGPDAAGLVAAVSGYLAENGAFVVRSDHFGDPETKLFFMRVVFEWTKDSADVDALNVGLVEMARRRGLEGQVHDRNHRPRLAIAVTKQSHCLADLLHRIRFGHLNADAVVVISNHLDLKPLADWYGVEFLHLPHTSEDRSQQEELFRAALKSRNIELLILARYMRILTPDFAREWSGRCINIHHSFLPSFIGAKPYHRAHACGVKLIGATAHYVIADLDEGPIIEQEVTRVSHLETVEGLIASGRDIETLALARAVQWHVENRVMINGVKTVVFK